MDSKFSAKEPSLGYFYQVRYALYLLLSSRQKNNPIILIEALDDIEIREDDFISLFQTKYHAKRTGKLSDRSSDFWKTIRVWSAQINICKIDPNETIFTLVTTEEVSENSILNDIKSKIESKDIIEKLESISTEKTNKTNIVCYQEFNLLSDEQKISLIENMYITDGALDFCDIDEKIKNELKLSALPNQINLMLERLDGWFFNACINQLQGNIDEISFYDLQKQINYIIDCFRLDNLPSDFSDKIVLSDEEFLEIEGMVFSKQLNIIDVSNKVKVNAFSDYKRAFNQRSKWLKDDLLNPQEEIEFDKMLIDEWEGIFDLMLDESESLNGFEQKEYGREFYINNFVKNTSNINIRDRFKDKYLTRGSYHMLSDNLKVGWHPNFKNICRSLDDT